MLLIYHITPNKQVFFKSSSTARTSRGCRVWDSQKTKKAIGPSCSRILPVIHAITGCDTTSQMYGIGKGAALKKFIGDEELVILAEMFMEQSSKVEIVGCGKLIIGLYGGVFLEGLDLLRFWKFTRKVMGNATYVQVQSMPPTSASAKYHSLCAYFHVQEWIGAVKGLQPTE